MGGKKLSVFCQSVDIFWLVGLARGEGSLIVNPGY
jgi:hypothetical protein